MKWLELDQDNLRMKFSALNVDFSSLSPDPLGLLSPAQAGVKDFKDFGLRESISFTRWRHGTGVGGVVGNAFRLKRSYSTPGPVSTAMGDY